MTTPATDLRQAITEKLVHAGPGGVTLAELGALDPRTADHDIELLGGDEYTHIDAVDYGPAGVTREILTHAHYLVLDLIRDGAVVTAPAKTHSSIDPDAVLGLTGRERVVLHGWSTLPVRPAGAPLDRYDPEPVQHTDPEAIVAAWLAAAGGGGAAGDTVARYCRGAVDGADPYKTAVFQANVERLRGRGWDIRVAQVTPGGAAHVQPASRPGEELRAPVDGPVDGEEVVGVADAARISGLAETTVYTYVTRGTIAAPLPVEGSDALVWRRGALEVWARRERRPGPKGPRS